MGHKVEMQLQPMSLLNFVLCHYIGDMNHTVHYLNSAGKVVDLVWNKYRQKAIKYNKRKIVSTLKLLLSQKIPEIT